MLLGDSFTFGAGVAAEENIANYLWRALGTDYEVMNLAIPGWGIDQMFLAYREFAQSFMPDIVVLAFIDEDVERVLEAYRHFEGVNKPSFAIREGHFVPRSPISIAGMAVNFATGHSAFLGSLAWHLYLYRDARPLIDYIVRIMAAASATSGGRFIVMRIPTLGDDTVAVVGFHSGGEVLHHGIG